MALPVVATLLVAFALAFASPSSAQQDNVLNVGKYTQLGSYDPHAGALDTLWWTGNNFYESLLDLNEDLSGPRPVLATSWTASKDGKTYTFKLREGVKFSDGTPFDSAAVKLSVERAQALKKAASIYVKPIARVETPSPSTVVFHLEQPNNTFLPGLRFLLVVSPKALKDQGKDDQAQGWLRDHTVGTGPYVLEKWEPNIIHVGKKNPHYWRGWPANKFTTINLRHIYEPETQRLMIEKGELDWSENVTKDALPALKRNSNLTVYEKLGTSLMVTYLNTNVAPTKDLRVRQALHHLWNQEAFNAITGHAASPGPIFTPLLGKDWRMENPYPYNPDKAKQLLAESGVTLPLEVRLTAHNREADVQQAQLIQAMLDKVGVKINLDIVERVAWGEKVRINNDFEMATRQSGVVTDPSQDLLITWAEGGNSAYHRAKVPGLLDTLQKADTEYDEKKRHQHFVDAQKLMHESAWFGYMWFENGNFLVNKRIQGFPAGWGSLREAEWWINE
jgi:peptide/nickel transport system substrate-binding protein